MGFAIIITNIIYRDEEDEHRYCSIQSTVRYDPETNSIEDVRETVGITHTRKFLKELRTDLSVDDLVMVYATVVGKDPLQEYVRHLAKVN